jgi:uncharacterized repeat protein (TIGR02543 family)
MVNFPRKILMKNNKSKLMLLLMMLASLLSLTSCGDKKQSEASVVIEIPALHKFSAPLVYAKGGSGYEALIDTTAPYAPIDVSGFDCILVNVVGPGIGEWDTNQSRVGDGSTYSYIGTYSKLIPVATGGTVEVKIKKGTKRFIQLLGIKSTVGCPSSVTSTDLNSVDKFPGIFIIGNVQKDIIKDEQVNIASTYDVQQAADVRGSETQPVPTHADETAPSIGAGTVLAPSRSTTTVGLTWLEASDNATLTAQLKYKVVYSTTLANLSTITNANAADVGMDWTANTTSATVSGLTPNTEYFFAVLVKDAIGNMALYSTVSKTTSATGYTVTYSGNGNTSGSVPVDSTSYNNTAIVTVLGNTGSLAKTGYKFNGWNTAANGSGSSYSADSTFSISGASVTLYAQWVSAYSVTYNGNGSTSGSVPTDTNGYVTSDTITVLSNVNSLAKTGYKLVGWTKASDGSGLVYTSGQTFTVAAANVTLYAKWQTAYTITYNGNTNTSGSVPTDSSTYIDTEEITVASNSNALVKTGYVFSGWNTLADGSGTDYAAGSKYTVSGSNVTLYAKWVAGATYTVTYNSNGATGGSAPTDANAYGAGDNVTVKTNSGSLVKTGYAFAGWDLAADGTGGLRTPGSTFEIGGANVTLYAKWTKVYSITYNSNTAGSGSVPTDSTIYDGGETATVLGNTGTLAKTNYRFNGWNTAANGSGTSYSGGQTFTMPSADVTLYAQWSAVYTVTYNGNSNTTGSVPTDSNNYDNGQTVTVLSNSGTLTKTSKKFNGWNTKADGTGTSYAVGATFTMGSANVTLYAVWATPYTITYNANTGSGTVPTDSNTYATGDSFTTAADTGALTKSVNVLSGWNTAADGSGTDYALGDSSGIMGAANFTLYAQWTPYYTITYDGNTPTTGSVPTDSTKYFTGDAITVASNSGSLTKTSRTFVGWNTNSSGTGTDYAVGSTYTVASSNITLYAKWVSGTVYTVTYNGNGATGGSVPTDSYSYSSSTTTTVTVLGNTGSLTKTSSAFTGWNTKADGTGTSYTTDQTFTIAANTTLYAQWVSGYAITYDSNGATGGSVPTDNNIYSSSGAATVLGNTGALTKSSAAFDGWNTKADGTGTNYVQDEILTLNGANVTLYAKWLAGTTYTVTYNGNGSTSGSAPTDNNKYVTDQSVSVLGANTLAKTNSRFLGWSKTSSATSADYVVGDTFAIASSNVTLYATWKAVTSGKYFVTYDGNGATSGSVPVDTAEYSSGSSVTVLDNVGGLIKPNYTFSGWNTKADGTGTNYDTVTSSNTVSISSISSNVTLYAKWTVATTYAITYNANTGTGSAPTDSHLYVDGQSATILDNTTGMTKTGKTFAGWNTSSAGTGDSYAAGETLLMSGATTLYAVWSDSYTITYDKNTTTGSPTGTVPTDSNTYVTGSSATIKSGSTLSNTGYNFLGWNTASDGTGTGYAAGQTIAVGTASLTLYAIWAPNYYVATTGSDSKDCSTAANACLTISNAISKITNSKGGQVLVASGTYTINSSISLKTNVSVLGGYESTNWTRNISANETIISNTASGSSSNCFSVYTSSGGGGTTGFSGYQKIEGFTCQFTNGGSKTYYGVSVQSSPNTTIRYNKFKVANISSSSGSGTYAAINISGKFTSDIIGNVIDGNNNGTVGRYTYGIKMSSLGSGTNFNIINNVINTGLKPSSSSSYPQAIDVSTSNKIIATVRNNTIYSGAAVAGNSTATYGFGVKKAYKSSGYPKVKLTFDNNIVFGPTGQAGQYTYGVYCYSSYYCNVQSMKNNNFFTLKTFAKFGSSYSSIYNLEKANSAFAANNNNIEMVTNNYFAGFAIENFKLDTSCPSDIKFGGIDGYTLGWGYQNDLENSVNRTGNGTEDWSIGAYEKD